MKTSVRLIAIFTLLTLFLFGVFFTGKEIYRSIGFDNTLSNKMHSLANKQIAIATQSISSQFQKYINIVDHAATELSSRQWTKESLDSFLKTIIEKQKDLDAVCVAFKPYAFDKSMKLYAPYYARNNEKIFSDFVKYDYTLSSAQAGDHTEWYRDFINGPAGWTEPYWETEDQKSVITYSAHFFSPLDKKNPIGVVQVDINLDYVRKTVNGLALGKRSYGFVVSSKGTFVAYPIEDVYRKGKTLFDLAKEQKNKNLHTIGEQIISKKNGYAHYVNALANLQSIIFYQAIPKTNLIMAITFIKDDFFAKQATTQKHTKIKIAFCIIITLLLLMLLIIFLFHQTYLSLVICSICCSIILLCGIGYLWMLQQTHKQSDDRENILIFDHSSINKALLQGANQADKGTIAIKTGILINKIEHTSNTQVRLSAYVWQKYPVPCDASIERSFYLPQCAYGKNLLLQLLTFKEKNEKEEIYLWKLNCILDQKNLYGETFPFDSQGVDVLLQHPSFDKNVLLIPDLDEFQFMNSQALPGLSPSIKILDWFLEKSFFSFEPIEYAASMGMTDIEKSGQKYGLCFTVEAKRNLFGFIVMYLLPILIALLLLFFNICITNPSRIMGSLSLTSGIFLGLILAHSGIRKIIVGSSVVYLEYFYIVPYFLIILLLIDLVFYAQKSVIFLINYYNNLLLKVSFWPLFLLAIFIITGWMFW